MKCLKALFIGAICASLFAATASAQSFSDVPPSHPQYAAIESLKNLQVINGFEDGTFRADEKVTRAQALKMLLVAGKTTLNQEATNNFKDVPADAWFKVFVNTATELKIINGNPDGTFQPNETVVNAAFWKMLMLVFNQDVSKHEAIAASEVGADINEGDWFKKYASYAKTLGIAPLDGNGNLSPSAQVTRGDAARMIYKLMVIQRGGEAQKNLSIAEVKVIETFLAISLNQPDKAMRLSEQAVQFADSALSLEPDDAISSAARELTLGARELASAHKSLAEGNKEKMLEHTAQARFHAGEAYNFAPQTQPLGKKIKSFATLIESANL